MKTLYHIVAILILSVSLYAFFSLTDLFYTHSLADLLLNVDFIPVFEYANFCFKFIFHIIFTTLIYVVFQGIRDSYVYPAGILIIIVLFAVIYLSLINWSVNPKYQFYWSDYFVWMLGHTIFIFLVAFILRFEKHFWYQKR
ncbi:hypothetical protein [Staphylococcus sp. EZ-P03]|uniref:hypothetical protein n=1 Tax=Staphylococcus sp. EZ-P03 TaxID=2282739 RepID=UPI000DF84143|nr:hypothetical protein [Staphylococcus sp. EZ-P03]